MAQPDSFEEMLAEHFQQHNVRLRVQTQKEENNYKKMRETKLQERVASTATSTANIFDHALTETTRVRNATQTRADKDLQKYRAIINKYPYYTNNQNVEKMFEIFKAFIIMQHKRVVAVKETIRYLEDFRGVLEFSRDNDQVIAEDEEDLENAQRARERLAETQNTLNGVNHHIEERVKEREVTYNDMTKQIRMYFINAVSSIGGPLRDRYKAHRDRIEMTR